MAGSAAALPVTGAQPPQNSHNSRSAGRKPLFERARTPSWWQESRAGGLDASPEPIGPQHPPDNGSHRFVECRPATPTSMVFGRRNIDEAQEDVHHHGHDYTLRSSETRTPDHSRRVPRAASLASAFSRIVVTPSGATILASLRNTPNALFEVLITAGRYVVKIPVGRGSSADSSCRCQRLQPLERVRYFRTSQIEAAACSFGLLRPCSHRSSVRGSHQS